LPEALFVCWKKDRFAYRNDKTADSRQQSAHRTENPPIDDKEPLIDPHPTDAAPTQQQKVKTKKTIRASGICQKLCLLRKR